jgi:hypothetical protein
MQGKKKKKAFDAGMRLVAENERFGHTIQTMQLTINSLQHKGVYVHDYYQQHADDMERIHQDILYLFSAA